MMRLFACATALWLAGISAALAGNYFDTQLLPPTLLDPPPREGSVQWQQDVATIIDAQAAPDPAEIAKAGAEVHMKPEMITQVLVPSPSRAKCPQLFALLDRVSEDGREVNRIDKEYWNTRRPYIASAEVKALVDAHANPAYPSGHTSGSLVWSEVAGELLPEARDALRARAAAIAQHRVLVGMHYPSDLEGGRQEGRMILGALWQSAAFHKDFELARGEIAAGCAGAK